MSRTEETTLAYLARGYQLWKRASKEFGCNQDELKPKAFIGWLEDLLPTLEPVSRRQYIASVKAYLTKMQQENINEDFREIDDAVHYANKMNADNYNYNESSKKPWKGKTSSQKSKQCSDNFIISMVAEAKNIKGKWIESAILWMVVNRLVGLRPSEWRTAKIILSGADVILEVQNGKHSNGRANGEKRNLYITDLKHEELSLIKLHLDKVSIHATDDKTWHDFYNGIRKAVYKMTRKILGSQRKYPSLYTTRHQFSADAKSEGLSKVEVAALMGHAVDETAGIHYGKKKHGRGICRVRPDCNEVATVKIKEPRKPHDSRAMT